MKRMTENEQNNDSTISSTELEAIEKDVLKKDLAEKESLKEEVRKQVMAEVAAEQKLKDLETEKKQLEDAVKKQAEDKKVLAESQAKEIEELKAKIGTSKAVHNNENPFGNGNTETTSGSKLETLTVEQVKEVDDLSKEAFLESLGLHRSEWK